MSYWIRYEIRSQPQSDLFEGPFDTFHETYTKVKTIPHPAYDTALIFRSSVYHNQDVIWIDLSNMNVDFVHDPDTFRIYHQVTSLLP